MKLPRLQAAGAKRKRDIVAFRGLNRTENCGDGEIKEALNLSTKNFPCLSQRGRRVALEGYASPDDIFQWDNHLVVVDNGILCFDGEALDNVSSGKKQFAVVNTKLCVFPDKVYIDLTNNSFGHLDAREETTGRVGSATFTKNSFTVELHPVIARNLTNVTFGGDATSWNPAIYTYGTDQDSLAACFVNGEWDTGALDALESLSGVFSTTRVDNLISVGQIFIPEKARESFAFIYDNAQRGRLPDKSQYNSDGYYGVFTYADPAEYSTSNSKVRWHFDIYHAGSDVIRLDRSFKPGDAVSITGSPLSLLDVKRAIVSGVDPENNRLTFDSDIFHPIAGYVEMTESVAAGQITYLKMTVSGFSGRYWRFTPDNPIRTGDIVGLSSDYGSVIVFRNSSFSEEYSVANDTDSGGTEAYILTQYKPDLSVITITRQVPNLDYICEKDNRLWGVSNAQINEIRNPETGEVDTFTSRAVYASALGDPTNWWTFDGVNTDSYQVAVGSEGNFTGICAFDGAVCCWKEHRLHKIFGGFPSEYYMTESRLEGIAAGSDRSMSIVNETLYYNGVSGVYAFGGGTPVLIGYELGGALQNAVGGTDGKRWYLSGTREDGESELLVYDLVHRLWMREDNTDVSAFALVDGEIYFLSGNTIYRTEQGDDDALAWRAQFATFGRDETTHRYYLRVVLKLDMSPGSSVSVSTSEDYGEWRGVFTADTDSYLLKNIEIPVKRCDRLDVRINGVGKVLLRAVTREYMKGSERE